MRTCTVEGCTKPLYCSGLCSMHRTRLARHGSTNPTRGSEGTIAERYERFVSRATEGCWEWTGATNERGYGTIGGKYAHRISYEIHVGPIPDGLWVLHHCDNPPCTNPDHLFLGTHADNMADAVRKGRLDARPNRPIGEAVGTSIFTTDQVREIRRLHAAGLTYRALASQFGTCRSNIGVIVRGETWKAV